MRKKSDFLFSSDGIRFYFPWMCWLMVFISTLICGGGILIYNSLSLWQKGISGSLTVQINTYDEEGHARGDVVLEDIEKAVSILRTTPGVEGVSVLDEAQMNALMAPWIGADVAVSGLPLPKLIDVQVDTNNPPSLEQLQTDLAARVPAATMDSHRIWLSGILKISQQVLHLIFFIVGLLALTIAFTVSYTTRSSLKIHESVIRLVHMMGAKDLYITSQYAWHNFKLALIGGILGSIFSAPLLWMIVLFFQKASDTIFQTQFSLEQWGLLITIPVFVALLVFVTTLKTVLSYLRQFL